MAAGPVTTWECWPERRAGFPRRKRSTAKPCKRTAAIRASISASPMRWPASGTCGEASAELRHGADPGPLNPRSGARLMPRAFFSAFSENLKPRRGKCSACAKAERAAGFVWPANWRSCKATCRAPWVVSAGSERPIRSSRPSCVPGNNLLSPGEPRGRPRTGRFGRLVLDPSSWRARSRLGTIQYSKGHFDGAIKYFLQAEGGRPGYVLIDQSGLGLLPGRPVQGSQGSLPPALAVLPEGLNSRLGLAMTLEAARDYTGAKQEYQSLLAIDPANEGAYRRLGRLYRQLGEAERAEKLEATGPSLRSVAAPNTTADGPGSSAPGPFSSHALLPTARLPPELPVLSFFFEYG